jgi:hypothetical protein
MADDLYDVKKYTNSQLYDILDMNNPTDRELEAKIIHLINKYSNMQNESGNKLALFFQSIYERFYNVVEGEDGDSVREGASIKEGFESKNPLEITDISNTVQNKTVGYAPQEIASVQQFEYAADKMQLNPLIKQTIKRVISIDSQYRDINTNPLTTSFSFDLSEPLRDVVSLKLYSIQIPYTWYTIAKSYGSNFLYLKGASTGINDGTYDYKIEIPSGNYTPPELITAINKSFSDLSNNAASDVNFNGQPLFTYDSATSKTTFNLNLQKTFNESYYQMYFPQWTSPITDNSGSIAGYLGFNNTTYNLNNILSNQSYITTTTLNTETSQDYYLDGSNNYFTIVNYLNADVFSAYNPAISTVLNTFTIRLTANGFTQPYIGLATRSQIVSLVNTALAQSPYFDTSTSKISQVDITNPTNANYGRTYFNLTLNLNRNTVKYTPNSKLAVFFPTEQPRTNPSYPDIVYTIWHLQPGLTHCCFFFDETTNFPAQITSESPASFSSYVVDASTNIIFTCNTPGYTTGKINDFIMNVPQSTTVGYTLGQYLSIITGVFETQNGKPNTVNNNIFNMINTAASIDTNSKFNLTVDLTKTFTSKNYHISFDNTSLLGQMNTKPYGFPSTPWLIDQDLSSNPIANVFPYQIKYIGTGYQVDVSYICTISPNQNITPNQGNRTAPPVAVCLPFPDSEFPKTYGDYSSFISAIDSAITGTVVSIPEINDTQRVLSQSSFTGTLDSSNNIIDLSLNIVYSYSLTEAFYDISFVDTNIPITSSQNAWYYFDISSNYNLFQKTIIPDSNPTGYYPYAQIVGGNYIAGNQINILDGSNTIVFQTYQTNTSSSASAIPSQTIQLTIPPAPYTINTLYSEINSLFNKNPLLYGSQITGITKNNATYSQVQLNINRIFTSQDYNLVFYDPISFITCYSGSRTVQNTTWDSTIGWILGFRDYTQYSLTKSNQTTNTNYPFNQYYLSSINGSYTYNTTVGSTSNLLTNTTINLTGDTTLSTNLFNYFLISLDDYIQNHLNDGLVTITRNQTAIEVPAYSYATTRICDPATNTLVSTSTQQSNSNNVSTAQLYSLNQSVTSQQNTLKSYSSGPFIKDLFGIIPIKPPSKNGDYYIEFGGSLQNQERLYFGPVNIRKMSIQLLNDRGDVVDLNGSNWSFSFICEQLYRSTST